MKRIKLIFAALALILLVPSCENDGGDSVIKTQNAAVPDIKKVANSDPSINLIAVNNDEDINLSFTVGIGMGQENLSSLDVVLYYITGDGTVNKHVLESNLTTFPKTYTLHMEDLYAFFESVNQPSDIGLADKLIVSSVIHLKDGTTINMTNDNGTANYGANIATAAAYTVIQTYVVSCPLDDASNFQGNYVVVSDDWEDYGPGDIIPVEYNPENDGIYTFRIRSTNNPYIGNPNTSYMLVTIDPATSEVTVTSNEPFDYTGFAVLPITGSGTIGSCTGNIDLELNFGPYEGYFLSLTKE